MVPVQPGMIRRKSDPTRANFRLGIPRKWVSPPRMWGSPPRKLGHFPGSGVWGGLGMAARHVTIRVFFGTSCAQEAPRKILKVIHRPPLRGGGSEWDPGGHGTGGRAGNRSKTNCHRAPQESLIHYESEFKRLPALIH